MTTAYDAQAWHSLFEAVAGAAATFGGLLFVAVSLNDTQILENRRLPLLAARGLGIWLALVVLAVFVLTPGQSSRTLGIEVTALAAVLLAGVGYSTGRGHFPVERWTWTAGAAGLALLGSLPMLGAGISLLVGGGGGLYWAMGEVIAGFAVGLDTAWILLVEIRR